MSNEHFVYNPSTVDIRRSKFLMPSFWKGPLFHGDLVPLEITEILPGDSAKYDISLFIRTATPPIFPIMDTIRLSIAAFYVPTRLVWAKTKEYYGENTEGYGIQTEVLEPRSLDKNNAVSNSAAAGSSAQTIATYLGLVRQGSTPANNSDCSPLSLTPIRCFYQVYNDWFRSENFMDPYLWNHTEVGDGNGRPMVTLGGSNVYPNDTRSIPKVCKQLDRFTSALPWAQKGSPVLLPLGSEAPIVPGTDHDFDTGKTLQFKAGIGDLNPNYFNHLGLSPLGNTTGKLAVSKVADSGAEGYVHDIIGTNAVADLSAATAASVNQLRLAFATQRYLEALARSGSKYREYIKGMFGVNIGDTTAQMAEYLGGMTIELNIDQVLQTTDYAAGSSTKLGAPGASSTSAASKYLFTKSFAEPGYLVVVAYTKHNRTYGQGLDEIFQKHEILERYNPKFANIGEQAIKKSLIYWTGAVVDDNTRWGFQEAWSEYRTKRDVVIGSLSPANSASYNFTNLSENFASAPTLNADFLKEDRINITRCLAGGIASPDYFLDVKFNREFVRPMPLYSIPGLIDHH